MTESYEITEAGSRERLVEFLTREGHLLLPFVKLIERSELALDELMDKVGRSVIEAVLAISAQGIAGPKQRGATGGDVHWYGQQQGRVAVGNRKVQVRKPRLRKKGQGKGGEVAIPAYEAIVTDGGFGKRLLGILLAGLSTRNYAKVVPEVAENVGIARSCVSREFVEASEKELKALCERRFDGVDILIVYVDGQRFGGHTIVTAVGVDSEAEKHVLGLAEGATENATVVRGLLEDLVKRGVKAGRRRLFVVDGSKALRTAIDEVYGSANPIQRCRNHKVKNVVDYLPKELKGQMKSVMKAAYRLDAGEGMARLKKQAEWLKTEHPSAAESLLEGLEETFTVNRLGLSGSLKRCLCTTNVIENPHSGARAGTRRVTRWRDGKMVMRWAAARFLAAEKNFRKIMGHEDLWMLKAILDEGEPAKSKTLDVEKKTG